MFPGREISRLALVAALLVATIGLSATPADARARPLTTGVAVSDVGPARPLSAPAPISMSPAEEGRPLATGVTVSDTGVQQQLGFERIRQTGATLTRIIVYWSMVAPAAEPANWNPADPADPNYDWSVFDSQIQLAVNAGLEPLVMLYSAPAWAERCKSDTAGICDPDPAAFARFAKAAAQRYDGTFGGLPDITYWEPWNEPNLFLFLEPQYKKKRKVSPGLYRTLLNRFATAVKGADPGNRIVAGGLAPIEVPGAIGPLDFARRLMCMQGRAKPKPKPGCAQKATFDIWANNPYTTGGPTHQSAGPDDVSLGDLREMAALLKAAKRAGKIRTSQARVPFWVTEFSWDSAPPDPGGVPMGLLCRWTAEAMFRSWQAGVSKFFWLSLRDWQRADGLPYSQTIESGLYFRGPTLADDKPKRVLKAFRFPFVAFRKSKAISIWGRTPDSSRGKVSLWFRRGGGWKRLATVRADRNGIFRANVKTRLGTGNRGEVRARVGTEASIPFSLKPVKDFRQPPFGQKG